MTAASYPCACGCGRPIGAVRVGVFRHDCTLALLRELRQLQDAPPDVLATLAADLDAAGAHRLAGAAVGALPFERIK